MNAHKLLWAVFPLAVALPFQAHAGDQVADPNAGKWRTWVISSGKDYRVPPPPGPSRDKSRIEGAG